MTNLFRSCRTGNDFVESTDTAGTDAGDVHASLHRRKRGVCLSWVSSSDPLAFQALLCRSAFVGQAKIPAFASPMGPGNRNLLLTTHKQQKQLWKPGLSSAMSDAFRFREAFGSNPSGGSAEVSKSIRERR